MPVDKERLLREHFEAWGDCDGVGHASSYYEMYRDTFLEKLWVLGIGTVQDFDSLLVEMSKCANVGDFLDEQPDLAQLSAFGLVSTQRQGASGLGLDAQRIAVTNYLRERGEQVGEIVEIESGRKGGKARPELIRALAQCKAQRASLVIGKLDRLARDVRFFLEVIDDSGVDIRFADLPDVCPGTDEGRMILVSMENSLSLRDGA